MANKQQSPCCGAGEKEGKKPGSIKRNSLLPAATGLADGTRRAVARVALASAVNKVGGLRGPKESAIPGAVGAADAPAEAGDLAVGEGELAGAAARMVAVAVDLGALASVRVGAAAAAGPGTQARARRGARAGGLGLLARGGLRGVARASLILLGLDDGLLGERGGSKEEGDEDFGEHADAGIGRVKGPLKDIQGGVRVYSNKTAADLLVRLK